MARRGRRYYRPKRASANYTWQPWYIRTRITTPADTTEGQGVNGNLATQLPGVGDSGDPNNIKAFEDDHVLERIRGGLAHNGSRAVQPSGNTWFPFSLACVKIPVGFNIQDIDLFDNSQGDDFLFRHDVVCNVSVDDAQPNWHMLDSKSRRKFEVGDKIAWLWSLIAPANGAFNVDIAINARFLWKLKI